MLLFLIENDQSVNSILNLPEFSKGEDIIICFNYLVYLKLIKEKLDCNFYFVEDLLTKDNYSDLHKFADYFAENWYKKDGEDKTVLENISYGEITRSVFSRNYSQTILLKYGEVIRIAKDRWEDISTIYCDFNNRSNYFFFREDDFGKFFNKKQIVEIVACQLNVNLTFLECPYPIPSAIILKKRGINFDFKYYLMEGIKFLIEKILLIISFIFFYKERRKGKIYYFSYFNAKNLLLSFTNQTIVSGFIVGLGKSLIKFLFSGSIILDFNKIKYHYDDSEKEFIQKIKELFSSENMSKGSGCRFFFNGVNYGELFSPVFQDIVENVIPSLIFYARQVKRAIDKYNICTIVLNEEIDEYQRAIINVCTVKGIKSVFLDHGIQGHNHAQKVFDRDGSDIVICAGDFYKDYYMKQSKKERICLVLGNPSLDIYSKKKVKCNKIKNILFLTFEDNFYARLDRFAYQEKYYAEILPLFNGLLELGINIFYKPHFENKQYHEYLFEFFSIDINKINYVEGQSFDSIIYDMDLMVCNVSNCFFEAQAAGVPTIFFEPNFNHDAFLPPLNAENGEEVIRVGTGEELLKIIEANIDDTSYLNSFLENFLENYSSQYMGILDGNASKRISDYLEKKLMN